MQALEGVLPNIDLGGCTRDQLKEAFTDRFFPCPECEVGDFSSSQNLRQQLTPERLACIEQGTTAWQYARSRHITGSRLGDLLGFNLPQPNRVLVQHHVYHLVADRRQAQQQLTAVVAALRYGWSAAAGQSTALSAYGTLCCAWGCKHEAAALHTLLHYTPPDSLLFDSGFVTLNSDTITHHPQMYQDVFTPTAQGAQLFGTLGPLDSQQVVETLKLGCSLDGLLAVPTGTRNTTAATTAETAAGDGSCAVQHQQQRFNESSIRRAPPYTWLTAAGYQSYVVEVKCPAPFYPSNNQPCAFGIRGAASCQPYKCMKAHYYCQAQLSMLVTGVESCMFVVWTRARSWLLRVPVNKPWLHACLHLLMVLHTRYVQPVGQQMDAQQQGHEAENAASAAVWRESSNAHGDALPGNLFWYDSDPAVRQLYRQFILQTARLAAAMRSDVLPDPYAIPMHIKSSNGQAAAKMLAASSPPADWLSSPQQSRCPAAAQPVAAAAAGTSGGGDGYSDMFWVYDCGLGTHSCLVKSVNPHWSKQQPLQRGSWFLDRCDPDRPRSTMIDQPTQPDHHCDCDQLEDHDCDLPVDHPDLYHDRPDDHDDLRQAWLDHPLLDHVTTQPEGMLLLLQLIQQGHTAAQLESAAAAAAGGGGGALSPGPVLLAMFLKMEQCTGISLASFWQQLPHSAQLLVQDMRSALSRLTANSTTTTTAASALGSLQDDGPIQQYQRLAQQAGGPTAGFDHNAAAASDSTAVDFSVDGDTCNVADASSSGFCFSGPAASLLAAGGPGGGGDRGKDSLGALWATRRHCTTTAAAAAAAAARGSGGGAVHHGSCSSSRSQYSKHQLARKVVSAARSRQQQLARIRYQRAVRQCPVGLILQQCSRDVERVHLDQPVHQLLQQVLAEKQVNKFSSTRLCLQSSKTRKLCGQQLVDQQQIDDTTAAAAAADGDVMCVVIDRVRSAPAVLQTGQFVTGAVRVSSRTGGRVFKRQFEGSSRCLPTATTAAAGRTAVRSDGRMRTMSVPAGSSHGGEAVSFRSGRVTAAAVRAATCAATMRHNKQSTTAAADAAAAAGRAGRERSSAAARRRRSMSWPGALGSSRRKSPTAVLPPPPPMNTAVAAVQCDVTGKPPQESSTGSLPAVASAEGAAAAADPSDKTSGQQNAAISVMMHDGTPQSPTAAAATVSRLTGGGSSKGRQPCRNLASRNPASVVGWCKLNKVPPSPTGLLTSVGAVTAAARQVVNAAVDTKHCSDGFQILLRSRRPLSNKDSMCRLVDASRMLATEVQCHCRPAHAVHSSDAQMVVPAARQYQVSAGTVKQDMPNGSCSGSAGAATTRDGGLEAADSVDAELDDLIASGAFDELLSRTKEDWERVDVGGHESSWVRQ